MQLKCLKVRMATGGLDRVSGTANLPVLLAGISFEVEFRVVSNLTIDCILGIDFMRIYGITLNFEKVI